MEMIERTGVVKVKPFKRTWLPDGHDGEIRYTNCADFLAVPINMRSGEMMTGLTEKEERSLEEELLLPPKTLSRYNKTFWGEYKQMIKIDKNGIELDLSKPWDYIRYKNLLVHPKVAKNEAEKFDNPEYEYVLTSVESEAKFKNQFNRVKQTAYVRFDKLNMNDKRNVLKLYGHRTDESHSEEVINSKLFEKIEESPATFIERLDDPDFKMKVFIDDCLQIKALVRSGAKYMITGGEVIGMGLSEVIDYLNQPLNQDVYISLKSQLELSKDTKIPKKKTE